jgi:hypothetical protein
LAVAVAFLDRQGRMVIVGTSKESKRKPATKQHDPTPEERDERVSLHPRKAEDVLRKLLRSTPKGKRN